MEQLSSNRWQRQQPNWLHTDWLLASSGSTKLKAIEAYKVYVTEGKGQPSPWAGLHPNRVSQIGCQVLPFALALVSLQ